MAADPDRLAFDRLCGSEPCLTDIRPAGEVVPGSTVAARDEAVAKLAAGFCNLDAA